MLRALPIYLARLAFMAALGLWLYGMWDIFASRSSFIAVAMTMGGVGLMQLYRVFQGRLEPTGIVYRAPSGDLCVGMHGVHPNFVAAVEASRSVAYAASKGPTSADISAG